MFAYDGRVEVATFPLMREARAWAERAKHLPWEQTPAKWSRDAIAEFQKLHRETPGAKLHVRAVASAETRAL